MKQSVLVAVVLWTLSFATSQTVDAAPLTVNLAGTVTSAFSFSNELWPIGTFVSGSFTLDVGSGTFFTAVIDAVSGSMSWTTGSQPHTLTFTGTGATTSASSGGEIGFSLRGSDPLLPEIDALWFIANVHEDPLASTTPLYNALLASDIASFGLIASRGGSGFGASDLVTTPAFTVSAVPEPGTLALVGIGLLAARRRVKRSTSLARLGLDRLDQLRRVG